ncbi:MAG: ABC transporter ATP-binding protein [Rhizobiales bacterium PAR1]|nr:MAG: ABC transporter ATP-binding protein [Rhizobiales bacterium PAR1]
MRDTASILPLSVEGLGYAVAGKTLLEDITFTLPRGGLTAVLGANGSGKSLLLRLCHGLITPTRGSLHWALEEGRRAGRQRHAMVFQRPIMLRRSARANLDHPLAALGLDRAARQARIAEALERFGLENLAEQPARLLSGGEQQRLALARAWTLTPEVIFLDEPCSQLDPGATRQIEAMLSEFDRDGMTLMMATHDLAQARRLARNVLFLNGGRLIEEASAETFFNKPRTDEARAFLTGNLLW